MQRKGQEEIVFRAVAPKELVMPNASVLTDLQTLIKSKHVRFEMKQGVLLSGRVIGKSDRRPVEKINVQAYSSDASNVRRRFVSSTDRDGNWTLILPRSLQSVNLAVRGVKQGYLLDGAGAAQDMYSRIVTLRSDQSEIGELDFEVLQVPPLTVQVKDSGGSKVEGSKVTACVKYWTDGTIGWWESQSRVEETDASGECRLFLDRPSQRGMVMASVDRNGKKLHGRAAFEPFSDSPAKVQLVLRPMSKLQGKLFWGEAPSKNTPLVLYEAMESGSGRWVSFGVRGEATTDDQGRYEFSAIEGLHYIVATKNRDKSGEQTVIHRTPDPVTNPMVRIPDVELRKLAGDRIRLVEE